MEAQWDLLIGSSSRGASQDDLVSPFHSLIAKHFLAQVASSVHVNSSDPLPKRLSPPSFHQAASYLDALKLIAACLQAFIQLNWTGPDLPLDVRPATLLRWANTSSFPPRSIDAGQEEEDRQAARLEQSLNNASLDELTWQGEPAYHLCQHPIFLVLAKKVIQTLEASGQAERLESLAWWKLRAVSLHNRILDSPVQLGGKLLASVDRLIAKLASRAAASSSASSSSSPCWPLLHARLLLERGLAVSKVGQDKEANELFAQAGAASGLKYELSGALGKKTKFQKEEKSILVVLAESSEQALAQEPQWSSSESTTNVRQADDDEAVDDVPELPKSGWKAAPSLDNREDMPSNYVLNDDTLLEQTKFTSNSSSSSLTSRDPANQPPLAPLDQAVLLALSLAIGNAAPENGLTTSQISAFVARVALHPRNWSVYTMALLLRSRLEATRTRTAERAVLQLQALLDQMPTTDSTVEERLRYFNQLDLPPRWEMQAELAKRYATLGVLRSALEIFERIELWEEVVQCLGALGRQEEGIEVLQDLLAGKKTEAPQELATRKAAVTSAPSSTRLNAARQGKLWCLLGDLQPEQSEAHYLKAWELSGNRSARAARSLGGFYFAQAAPDYSLVITWLRRAVKISSLMSRSWFMLGCAYMRKEEYGRAARSFRRCTAIDEEDGEAWNNLASCYLRMVGESSGTMEDLEGEDVEMDQISSSQQDDDDDDASSDAGTISTNGDSAVDIATDDEDDHNNNFNQTSLRDPRKEILTPFILKTLAHRCLKHSLRYTPDSWRVWSNYMIVSVDVGELNEACRAFAKVIAYKARGPGSGGKVKEEDIDWQVLDRLVDAVVRAPGKIEDLERLQEGVPSSATAEAPTSYEAATSSAVSVPVASTPSTNMTGSSPNEGRGLYKPVLSLLNETLIPAFPHPRLHRCLARLYLWSRDYPASLEAHLAAYRCSIAGDLSRSNELVAGNLVNWKEAVEEVKETCDAVETLSGKMEKVKEGRFTCRSLIRTFMARNKEGWEDEAGWEELVELRGQYK